MFLATYVIFLLAHRASSQFGGGGYCTWSPDYDCYVSGWPSCCNIEWEECPENRPACEVYTHLGNCVDSWNYVDSQGYGCDGWYGHDCSLQASNENDWGYSEQEIADVAANCPHTCGSSCGCVDNDQFLDALGYDCHGWIDYECSLAASDENEWGYAVNEIAEIASNCPQTCNVAWCGCIDWGDFEDSQGYTCDGWIGYECSVFASEESDWGYSSSEIADVVANCPQTCGTSCGCVNNEAFVDSQNYNCDDWIGYECSLSASDGNGWGYTIQDVAEVVANCPVTCKAACGCVDDEQFIDSQGYDCDGWLGYDCTRYASDEYNWGYSIQEIVEVVANCAQVCQASCGCVDSLEFSDAQGYDCDGWIGYVCTFDESDANGWGYSDSEIADVVSNCPQACQAEWCDCGVDSGDFIDAQGYTCSGWNGYECTTSASMFHEWGYSSAEMEEVQVNCPETCDSHCGARAHAVSAAVVVLDVGAGVFGIGVVVALAYFWIWKWNKCRCKGRPDPYARVRAHEGDDVVNELEGNDSWGGDNTEDIGLE